MEVIPWDTTQNVYITPGESGLVGAAVHCCLMLATGFFEPVNLECIFKVHIKNCSCGAKNALERAC